MLYENFFSNEKNASCGFLSTKSKPDNLHLERTNLINKFDLYIKYLIS